MTAGDHRAELALEGLRDAQPAGERTQAIGNAQVVCESFEPLFRFRFAERCENVAGRKEAFCKAFGYLAQILER